MALRTLRLPDGTRKQPRRFCGKFVSEASCQTEGHLAVSLLAEMVVTSALQQMPARGAAPDAEMSDEALHALLAALRFVQAHGLGLHASRALGVACQKAQAWTSEPHQLQHRSRPRDPESNSNVETIASDSTSCLELHATEPGSASVPAATNTPDDPSGQAARPPAPGAAAPLAEVFDQVKACILGGTWEDQVRPHTERPQWMRASMCHVWDCFRDCMVTDMLVHSTVPDTC
jgi:hypothetical protein